MTARPTAQAQIDALKADIARDLGDLRTQIGQVVLSVQALTRAGTPAKVAEAPAEPVMKPEAEAIACTGTTKAGARCRVLTREGLCPFHRDQPAKAEPKAEPKASTRKAKAAPAKAKAPTKGSQSTATLTRSQWNHTLSAKARLAGGDTYRRINNAWPEIQALRTNGATVDEVLARFTRKAR